MARLYTILCVILLDAFCVIGLRAQSKIPFLEFGKSIEREIKGDESHRYAINVQAGQFNYIKTLQKGIDVVVRLFDPNEKLLFEENSPYGKRGEEPLWFIADASGINYIEIVSSKANAPPGSYALTVVEQRTPSSEERLFVDAGRLIFEGIKLGDVSRLEVRENVLLKYGAAVRLIDRMVTNEALKAEGYARVANEYGRANERSLALEYWDRAIEIDLRLGMKRPALEAMWQAQTFAPSFADHIDRNQKIFSLSVELNDEISEAYSLRELAFGHCVIGDFYTSAKYTKRSIELSRKIKHNYLLWTNYDNLGANYFSQGDYRQALENHLKAQEIRDGEGNPDSDPEMLSNFGNVYFGLQNFEISIDYQNRAFVGLEKQGDYYRAANALSAIGNAYLELQDYEKALEFFRRAQELRTRDPVLDAESYYNIAAVYRATGRISDAIENVQKALEVGEGKSDNSIVARSHLALSQLFRELGQNENAIKHANIVMTISAKFGYPQLSWSAQVTAAGAYLSIGKRAEARQLLEKSVAELVPMRTKITGPEEVASSFFERTNAPFQMLTELEVSEGSKERAFALTERMKAQSLTEALSKDQISVNKVLSSSEKEKENKLRNETALLRLRINERKGQDKADDLQGLFDTKRREFEAFLIRLYSSHPELEVYRGEAKTVELGEVANLGISESDAILEFVALKDRVLLFLITKDGKGETVLDLVEEKIPASKLAERINLFRSKIASGDLDFQVESTALYETLVGPASKLLQGKTNLIVVPDGPLWDLPFQALQDGKGRYLIEKAAISYAPSLTALREMKKRAKTREPSPDAELLAFGNPMVGKSTAERVQRVFMSEKLEPIPEAERLVNSLARMYGPGRSKVFTGADAREETAKTESPKYRIVQFATHGILNNSSPMYSHLVLAQNEKNPNEDGLLEAWEMKDLDLKADMVILSACDTARGKISNGEGVIGMTWAAFIAGAPTTVASQWKVESSSTTELMLEFHRQLLAKPRVSKSEALRRASLKLMKMPQYKHPSYWAGFVMIGDGS